MSGWFGLLGSGEFTPWSAEVDAWLLSRATGDGRVCVVPTASALDGDEVFEEWARRGVAHFSTAGLPAEPLMIRNRSDANDARFADAVAGASMVYFSGGNPAFLADTLKDSAFWRAVTQGLDRGMAYAGCSAGMACLGRSAPNSAVAELTPDFWQSGLSVFPSTWLGPHWDALDRYSPGLTAYVVESVPAGDVLVGVDEDTAIVGDGRSWDVLGSGAAHLYLDDGVSSHEAGEQFSVDLLR